MSTDGDEVRPEDVKLYIEMWKQTVAVQMHFNEIEWKIRGLALTALTFTVGASSYVSGKSQSFHVLGKPVSASAAVLFGGLVLWLGFYFVDQVWYHRLLMGSVKHGEDLEKRINVTLPGAGLTAAISASSPYTVRAFRHDIWVIHSKHKLQIFYWVGSLVLAVLALIVQTSTK